MIHVEVLEDFGKKRDTGMPRYFRGSELVLPRGTLRKMAESAGFKDMNKLFKILGTGRDAREAHEKLVTKG